MGVQIADSGSCSGRSAVGERRPVRVRWGPGAEGKFLAQYFSKHLAGCSFLSLCWSSLTLRTFAESSEFSPLLPSQDFIFGRSSPPNLLGLFPHL